MPRSEIHLDGGEATVIKALGLGGTELSGKQLLERIPEFVPNELIDILKGLLMQGYIVSDKQSFYDTEGLGEATFYVNSGYSKDLKEALEPNRDRAKSKRVRRE